MMNNIIDDVNINNDILEWEEMPAVSNGLVNINGYCSVNDVNNIFDLYKKKKTIIEYLNSGKINIVSHIYDGCKSKIRFIDEKTMVINNYVSPFKNSGKKNIDGLKKGNKTCKINKKTILRALNNLFLISEFKNHKTVNFKYRLSMITLTASSKLGIKRVNEKINRAFRLLYMYIVRYFDDNFMFVKILEKHKSGALHIHLISNISFIDKQLLTDKWNECLKKVGLIGGAGSTNIKAIYEKTFKSAFNYVAKYVVKAVNNTDGNSTYIASFSKGLTKKIYKSIDYSELERFLTEAQENGLIREYLDVSDKLPYGVETDLIIIKFKTNINKFNIFKEFRQFLKNEILKQNFKT